MESAHHAPEKIAGMNLNLVRKLRSNVRNFLYPANLKQMEEELRISIERRDFLRAYFIEEMIKEGD